MTSPSQNKHCYRQKLHNGSVYLTHLLHLRDVRGAREEMPEPSVWEQPDMLRLDSPVSSDRGARSALRRMP